MIQLLQNSLFAVNVIPVSEFLEKYKGQYCMRSQTSIVRCKTFPQTEKSFLTHQFNQYILNDI